MLTSLLLSWKTLSEKMTEFATPMNIKKTKALTQEWKDLREMQIKLIPSSKESSFRHLK